MGQLADIVRQYLPEAQIDFAKETGGCEISDNYLIDNSRLVEEFYVQFQPFEDRVRQTINGVRRAHDLPTI